MNNIGLVEVAVAFVFALVAGILAILLSTELAKP
jgi:photosystem I reaction center subunit XII